jgi:hypothetical protein
MAEKESLADKTNRESREERQTQALERMASSLEEIRSQLISLNHHAGALSRGSSSFRGR